MLDRVFRKFLACHEGLGAVVPTEDGSPLLDAFRPAIENYSRPGMHLSSPMALTIKGEAEVFRSSPGQGFASQARTNLQDFSSKPLEYSSCRHGSTGGSTELKED